MRNPNIGGQTSSAGPLPLVKLESRDPCRLVKLGGGGPLRLVKLGWPDLCPSSNLDGRTLAPRQVWVAGPLPHAKRGLFGFWLRGKSQGTLRRLLGGSPPGHSRPRCKKFVEIEENADAPDFPQDCAWLLGRRSYGSMVSSATATRRHLLQTIVFIHIGRGTLASHLKNGEILFDDPQVLA